MRRRSLLVALALLALLLGGAGLGYFLVVVYEPDVYQQAAAPPGDLRVENSQNCLRGFSQLLANSKNPPDNDWYVTFNDVDVNSYFEEGFISQGLAPRMLPDGMSRPHVVFEPGKAHIAFRYGTGGWNTVVTIDLRVWLAREEPNAVALELESVRAGALPISSQWLVDEFSKAGRKFSGPAPPSADDAAPGLEDLADAGREGSGMDLTWYRLNGHPVALLRFQADQAHPTLLLQDIRLDRGSLTIRGRASEAALHTLLMQFPPGLSRPILD
jgi:hypothetical protein